MGRRFVKLKVWVAGWLCHPAVGRLVGALFSDRIPSGGCVIDTRSPAVTPLVKAAILFGLYESAERRLARRHLPSGNDVLELGASLGVVSSHLARRLDPGRALVCVEANPALLETLAGNVHRNAPHVRLEVVHAAIDYDHSGERVGFVRAGHNMDSRLAATGLEQGMEWVSRTTLRRLLEGRGSGPWTLVSDVEGAEAGLLEEDVDSLRRFTCIIIELHQTERGGRTVTVEEMMGRIERAGFRLAGRRGGVCAFVRPDPGERA